MRAERTYRVAAEGLLTAAALVLQASHGIIGFPAGFMTVDLVGVPALIATMLFGFKSGFRVLILTALGILLIPDTGWIGAVMKFSATLPSLLVLAYGTHALSLMFVAIALFITAGGIEVLVRDIGISEQSNTYLYRAIGLAAIVLPAGIAHAVLPDRHVDARVRQLSLYLLLIFFACVLRGALMLLANYYFAGPLWFHLPTERIMEAFPPIIIIGWNAVQTVVEFSVAWLLVFWGGLGARYGENPSLFSPPREHVP